MSGKTHIYTCTLAWTGNTGRGTANYTAYSRDQVWAIGINMARYLPHQEYWLAIVAYMVLMVGNLVRGL